MSLLAEGINIRILYIISRLHHNRKEISGSQLPSAVYEKLQLPFGSHFRFHPRPFCVNAPPSSVGKVSGEIRDGSETLDQCDSQLNL